MRNSHNLILNIIFAVFFLFVISCKMDTTTIDKTPPIPDEGNSILSFNLIGFENPNLEEDIEGTIQDGSITLTVPINTDVTNLAPNITYSDNATVKPPTGMSQDFSNPVKYTVKSESGEEKIYTVTILVKQNTANDIISFSFQASENGLQEDRKGTITGTDITLSLPFGIELKDLEPTIELSPDASVSPSSGIKQDFTNPVTYTVTAQDGTSIQEFTVRVTVEVNTGKKITSFVFKESDNMPNLQEDATGTIYDTFIDVVVPTGTDKTNLIPFIEVSPEASYERITGGSLYDFTNPVMYKVTAQDKSEEIHTVSVVNISSFGKLSAGYEYSMALSTNDELYTWGENVNSQLGYDNSTVSYPVPEKLGNLKWKAISAGLYHTLGITDLGKLYAWGFNRSKQASSVTDVIIKEPTQIGTQDWLSVSAGGDHSAGISSDGSLYTWGKNDTGQLGNGTSSATDVVDTPTKIGQRKWASVSAGDDHNLAISEDGKLYAWGRNNSGKLGIGKATSLDKPAEIGTDTWKAVSAGSNHSLGINKDGYLFAWGSNSKGQLGTTVQQQESRIPIQIGTLKWSVISAGTNHSLGITEDGDLYAWGDNSNGKLGIKNVTSVNVPTKISNLKWVDVAAGRNHSMALTKYYEIYTWGSDVKGQLGDSGPNSDRFEPERIN